MGNHLEHVTQAISERLRDEHRACVKRHTNLQLLFTLILVYLIFLPLIRWFIHKRRIGPESV